MSLKHLYCIVLQHGKQQMAGGGRVEARFISLLTLFFALLLPSLASGGEIKAVQGQKTWCVAKPSLDEATLAANLNYACSQVDCSILQRGFACFYPDTLMSHASIAMNLYYQSRGRNFWNCYFKGSGLVVTTDPSPGLSFIMFLFETRWSVPDDHPVCCSSLFPLYLMRDLSVPQLIWNIWSVATE
ncbi:hypothetical protein Cni_G00225 [Canna indica]|uniref:X8 domain-containing protein n=1 Tax=Canna indica TaxID=4628 RepID=A0AAQ3JKM7_9LILI|nr:hypothetical protein Cni_G00225 [Canna indica]